VGAAAACPYHLRGRGESYDEQEDRSQIGTGKKKADGRNGPREKKENGSFFLEGDRGQEEKRESRPGERAEEKTPPVRFRKT